MPDSYALGITAVRDLRDGGYSSETCTYTMIRSAKRNMSYKGKETKWVGYNGWIGGTWSREGFSEKMTFQLSLGGGGGKVRLVKNEKSAPGKGN